MRYDQGMSNTQYARFGAGCFWGVEVAFRNIEGVKTALVGYEGGTVEQPTYEQVCTGNTGHAEVVEVEFDPSVVSFRELVQAFLRLHDPTQLNRQGPDIGTQYRSVILTEDDDQAQIAREELAAAAQSGAYTQPIATTIEAHTTFWPAEDYHQQYLVKRGLASCHVTS